VPADRPQARGEFRFAEDPEAAAAVVRRVPRHRRERGQRQRRQAIGRRPGRGVLEEVAAEPAAGVVRVDGHLVDVQAAIDHAGHQVGDGLIRLIRRHPEQARLLAGGKNRQRVRLVLRDLGHADAGERLSGRPLDCLEDREFACAGRPGAHAFIIRLAGGAP